MSCEVWTELAESGERLLREGSPEREAAERHFRSCPRCARRAFLLDPSWAVSREASSAEDSGRLPRAELVDLERKILDAGRLQALDGSVRRGRRSIRGAAAAVLAAVVLAGGALLGTNGWSWRVLAPDVAQSAVPGSLSVAPGERRDLFGSAAVQVSLPVIGSLAPEAARVYDLGQDDFALVMVVHETLDL